MGKPDILEQLRSGLADPDGWWVETVVQVFRFIETEFEWRLRTVSMHFRGDYIIYTGPTYSLVLTFVSEIGRLDAEIWRSEDVEGLGAPRSVSLVRALEMRAPGQNWAAPQPDSPISEQVARETLQRWAVGLRQHANDVLLGLETTDLRFHHNR